MSVAGADPAARNDPSGRRRRVAPFADTNVSGSSTCQLAAPPKLVNPPSDPAWKPHAEAALKAVKGCDPLHVPDKYAEYYPSWTSRTAP